MSRRRHLVLFVRTTRPKKAVEYFKILLLQYNMVELRHAAIVYAKSLVNKLRGWVVKLETQGYNIEARSVVSIRWI